MNFALQSRNKEQEEKEQHGTPSSIIYTRIWWRRPRFKSRYVNIFPYCRKKKNSIWFPIHSHTLGVLFFLSLQVLSSSCQVIRHRWQRVVGLRAANPVPVPELLTKCHFLYQSFAFGWDGHSDSRHKRNLSAPGLFFIFKLKVGRETKVWVNLNRDWGFWVMNRWLTISTQIIRLLCQTAQFPPTYLPFTCATHTGNGESNLGHQGFTWLSGFGESSLFYFHSMSYSDSVWILFFPSFFLSQSPLLPEQPLLPIQG